MLRRAKYGLLHYRPTWHTQTSHKVGDGRVSMIICSQRTTHKEVRVVGEVVQPQNKRIQMHVGVLGDTR